MRINTGKIFLTVSALSAALYMTAYGATLNGATIIVTSPAPETEAFSEPDISGGNHCEIENVVWKKDSGSWEAGKKQRVTVWVTAEEGYSLSGLGSKKNWNVSGAEFVKWSRIDADTVTAELDYMPKLKLGTPEEAGWDAGQIGKAKWNKVKYATSYQVSLIQDEEVKKTLTVSGTSADFSSDVSNVQETSFKVRAIPNGNESGYLLAGEWAMGSDDYYYSNLGNTGGNWEGKGGGYAYKQDNGSYMPEGWALISGYWYYFNRDQIRQTGWQKLQDSWYLLDGEGKMQTGWIQQNGEWYFMNESGAMQTGWRQTLPGKWYYFYEDGRMAKDTYIENCRLDGTGLWVQ